MREIYADYAAGAPLRPCARAAMLAAYERGTGNASSVHRAGRRARAILEAAREEVAAAIGAHPLEVVFTSGATEANNLALAGVAAARRPPLRLAVPATEHSSVLEPARALGAAGHVLRVLPVSPAGHVAAGAVAEAGADLLALALVNAETGIALDAAALAEPVRARGGLVHLDAAQAAGTVPLDVRALGVDLLALSGPKVGGPAGTGALWVRRGVALAPLLRGGPQERELRAGTESVPALAGFAAALAAAVRERAAEAARLAALTARLRAGVAAVWPGARFAGADEGEGARAPHILSVTFPGLDGESLVAALDLEGVAASAGSACAAGALEPSHVLVAMGRSREEARSALRLSLGWASTAADVTGILEALARVAERVRTRERESPWRARAS